jgi:tetratricopeptide (TPR) repeat protein
LTGDMLTVYDEYGREMQISKEAWRTNVLPQQLRQHWKDADTLYQAIVMAVQDNFVAEVADAAAHLLELEATERSYTVRGIVLMRLGRLAEAEQVFRNYLNRSGPSGIVLTNLAKVYAEQGNAAKSEETLWKALEVDPNQDNGLSWWGAIHQERGGQAGFVAAMEQASRIPSSWRPQLWLARSRLEAKDIDGARRLYEHILKLAPQNPDALMMISGDLGNNGYLEEMIQLVLPNYRPELHGPPAGINLIEACLQLGRRADAERILNELFKLNLPPLRQTLMALSARLDSLKKGAISPSVEAPVTPRIYALDRPVWTGGLKAADWLLPAGVGPIVGFLALADETLGGSGQARSGPETDRGRLTRSIPLFLAEQLLLISEARTQTLIPVVPQVGPAVVGQPWSDDRVLELGRNGEVVPDYIVTGVIGGGLALSILDVNRGTKIATLEHADAVAGLADLAKQLQGLLRLKPRPLSTYFTTPSREFMNRYLVAEAQALIMVLVSVGVARREDLWGERNILDWFLRLALDMDSQIPKLMFVSGLAQSRGCGSQVYLEFKQQALKLLSDEKDKQAAFHRLSPLIFQLFDMPDELARAKASLLPGSSDAYRKWLEAL